MEAELETLFPQAKNASGLFRALGIGFFLSSALLSVRNQKDFTDNLIRCLYTELDGSQFQPLSDQLEYVNEHDMLYEEIITELAKEELQLQLETAFSQLYFQLIASDQAQKGIEVFLNDAEKYSCLRPLAQKLLFALDIEHDVSGTCMLRAANLAAYVRIRISQDQISVLVPFSYKTDSTEELLYENYDKEYREVIGVLAKSLAGVKEAGADCILLHSSLKHWIREAVKYDLPLDIPRLMLASDLVFTSSCTDCKNQRRATQLHCGHWKCHECVLVALYNQSLIRTEPEPVSEVQLENCCVLTVEQLEQLLSAEELKATQLLPTRSPQS